MTLFTRLLALLLVLGVVFAAPASVAASLAGHLECHEHGGVCHGDADEQPGNGCGGDHECPCACHVQVAVAIVVTPLPVSGPKVMVLDWLAAGDAMAAEGLPPGIEHPPQNA